MAAIARRRSKLRLRAVGRKTAVTDKRSQKRGGQAIAITWYKIAAGDATVDLVVDLAESRAGESDVVACLAAIPKMVDPDQIVEQPAMHSRSAPNYRSLKFQTFTLLFVAAIGCLVVSPTAVAADGEAEVVRVMSYNLWHGGDAGKQPLERTIEVIEKARADIVGLQESDGIATESSAEGEKRPDRAAQIAARLGWNYVDQGGSPAIISRFKIDAVTPDKQGARFELPSGREFYLFNIHFASSPYQPYQLLGIPYGDGAFLKTADEAIFAARAARGAQVERLLAEVKAALREDHPVFVTGDFNEPSHLDWTDAAAAAGLCPLAVEWPATKTLEAADFADAFRAVHPDPTLVRGLTWTPITALDDPKDRHDRIDFVFVGGSKADVRECRVLGESKEAADIVVTPYPSDHRAVVAEVELFGSDK